MPSELLATYHWPEALVSAVRTVKAACALFSEHTLLGIPLDWPLRFVVLGSAYGLLRKALRLRPASAAGLCTGVLVAKEAFDCIAVRDLHRLRAPDTGDVADVLAGLAGLATALALECWRRRRIARRQPREPDGR